MGKIGFWLPRTLSRAVSSRRDESPEPFHINESTQDVASEAEDGLRRRPGAGASSSAPRQIYRIGRPIIPSSSKSPSQTRASSRAPVPLSNASTMHSAEGSKAQLAPTSNDNSEATPQADAAGQSQLPQRSIRFPDEVDTTTT